jgi:phosphatidylglycerophosphatase A
VNFRLFFITVGYSGLSPKAPGTMGTLASLPLGIALLIFLGPQTLFLATLLITLLAIKAIDRYEADTQTHDSQHIVIDELVGMWFALSIAPGIMFAFSDLEVWTNGIAIQITLSFIFFRLFDIKKPSIIGRIDREAKGGLGVMGDDIIAGFAGGITSAIIWQIILKSGLIG